MKIEKRGNNYRVRKTVNGKAYSLSFDHRPTQKEIDEVIVRKVGCKNGRLTFGMACEEYIDNRASVLSPATIREYRGTLRRLSDALKNEFIDDITQQDVQKEINHFAKTVSPKTCRNYHGFISSVLHDYRPSLVLSTTLPQKENKEPYVPSIEEIQTLLEYAHNTPFEVPILLACASLRRGEICALKDEDVEGNIIHVRHDMVFDEHKEWVIKAPKNPQSVRDVVVPDQVIDAIRRNGLYKGYPCQITDWMDSAERKLGLKHFSIHKCRHFFASYAHSQGVPDADIMAAGGWKTDYVMKNVYRHSLGENSKRATTTVLNSILDKS